MLESSFYLNDPLGDVHDLAVYGTKAGIFLENKQPATMVVRRGNQFEEEILEPSSNVPYGVESHFCDVLQGRTQLCTTPEQGLAIQEMVEAIYRSAETGVTDSARPQIVHV